MTNTEKCEPHGFEDCCNIEIPEYTADECRWFGTGKCHGEVTGDWSASGLTFLLHCTNHRNEWLDQQQRHNRRYPDSPIPPSDFDPYYAGERWDEDY